MNDGLHAALAVALLAVLWILAGAGFWALGMSAARKGTDMNDGLHAARGITWAVCLSAVLWILAGAGFWALVVHWGWRK